MDIIAGIFLILLLPLVVEATTGSNDNEDISSNSSSCCSTAILELGGIPSKDVKRSAVAAILSELILDLHKDDNDPNLADAYGYKDGIYYESGVDAVYTARVKNEYCVAVFRGTTFMVQDMFSNLYIEPVVFNKTNVVNSDEGSDDNEDLMCDMHQGYHDAYVNFEYRSSVEDFLHNCKAECPDCDMVLTGHSQGGGIAAIASLYLQDLMSYVITFGAPQSLGAGCLEIFNVEERCRWYHYIMATKGPLGRGLVYDPIPMLYSKLLDNPKDDDQTYARNGGLAFIGNEIIVSSDDPSSVIYVGFDKHRFVDLTKIDGTGRAHSETLYANVLERQSELYNYDDDNHTIDDHNAEGETNCTGSSCRQYILPSTGFSVGSSCNRDEKTCAEGTECGNDLPDRWFGSWKTTCQQQQQLDTTSSDSANSSFSSATGVVNDKNDESITTSMALNSNISSGLRRGQPSRTSLWFAIFVFAAPVIL